jgi:dTDP-4-dehydrorhamnose 3,5-epimerase
MYLWSMPDAPGREHGVDPLDPALGIDWPLGDLP